MLGKRIIQPPSIVEWTLKSHEDSFKDICLMPYLEFHYRNNSLLLKIHFINRKTSEWSLLSMVNNWKRFSSASLTKTWFNFWKIILKFQWKYNNGKGFIIEKVTYISLGPKWNTKNVFTFSCTFPEHWIR